MVIPFSNNTFLARLFMMCKKKRTLAMLFQIHIFRFQNEKEIRDKSNPFN